MVEAVAHEDLEGDRQLFPSKHLLQSAAGIMLLERNVDFHKPLYAGYKQHLAEKC
jgi:hypothetical protein